MILPGTIAAASAAVLVVLALGRDVPPRSVSRAAPFARLRELVRRDRSGAAAIPILQATHAGLRSGLPLVGALRAAIGPYDQGTRGPIDDVVRAVELNGDADAAVAAVRARVHDRRVLAALDAIALAAHEDLPASRAAALIGSVAERLTFEAHVRSEVEARASGVRTQIAILALVVPTFALYLVATLPGLAATLATPLSTHLLLPLATILEVSGVVFSRSIVTALDL